MRKPRGLVLYPLRIRNETGNPLLRPGNIRAGSAGKPSVKLSTEALARDYSQRTSIPGHRRAPGSWTDRNMRFTTPVVTL